MVKKEKVNHVDGTTERASVDKISLCVVITTVIIILVVVIVGVCVRFLLEDTISRIILIILICFLAVLGVLSLSYLEIRRRTVAKNNKNRTVTVRNGQYYNIRPSAPAQDTSWEYSNRATMPA